MVLCYFQLCNEDYEWWWRSFLNSGASGLYLLGYSFVYFFTQVGRPAPPGQPQPRPRPHPQPPRRPQPQPRSQA